MWTSIAQLSVMSGVVDFTAASTPFLWGFLIAVVGPVVAVAGMAVLERLTQPTPGREEKTLSEVKWAA